LLSVLLTVALSVTLPAQAEPLYRGGAVATAHPLASRAALAMLDQGGNAVDAAVAAAFVLAVVAPYHTGLGGGGFALWFNSESGKTRALDFREVAPDGASRNMFIRDGKPVADLSRDGALSVAVPGAVAGLLELHAKGGKLKREVVLAPAIHAAHDGFLVTPQYQRLATQRLECLRSFPEATRLYLRPGARGVAVVPPLGERIRQPELARTLEAIARHGSVAFYSGAVARSITETVDRGGGVLTRQDLTRYQPRWREPLETRYRGHRILTMPLPSAGGVTLVQVLGMLELLRPEGWDFHDPEALHLYVESLRRSFFDRANSLGDPAFVEVPLAQLLSHEHLEKMAHSIDPLHATLSSSLGTPPGPPPSADKHTTHLSVIDSQGNALAMTTTHNYLFGSCVVTPGTGVLLNDEMDDFAAAPLAPNVYGLVQGESNTVASGKIPLSSMTPTLVFQKDAPEKIRLVVGSPGGSTIPTSVIQVISNVIDSHMDVVRAVGAGRIHHQYLPDEVWVDRFSAEPATLKALEAKGHHLKHADPWGSVQAVAVDPVSGLRSAAADPRTEGLALGQD
jgi:gamma-glutamyltranspeptidase/glutathione hydrolase